MLAMYDLLKQFLGKNVFLCTEIEQELTVEGKYFIITSL